MKSLKKTLNTYKIEKYCIFMFLFSIIITITIVSSMRNNTRKDISDNEVTKIVAVTEQNVIETEKNIEEIVENNEKTNLATNNNKVKNEINNKDNIKINENISATPKELNNKKQLDDEMDREQYKKSEESKDEVKEKREENEIQNTTENKLDFSKYDRYTPALNGGFSCFERDAKEINKLENLINKAVEKFGYTSVNIKENKEIAMETRHFTANEVNVEKKVYKSEDFTIYYYAEIEYALSSKGEETFIQKRSYITIR